MYGVRFAIRTRRLDRNSQSHPEIAKFRSQTETSVRASSLFHLDLEPDALLLDYDPPRLNLEYAERRDDVTFSHQLTVDERLWLRPHHDALQLHLTRLIFQVLN